jgi:hypothetical protein
MRKRDRPKRPTHNVSTQRAENRHANPETPPNPTQQTVPRDQKGYG